MFQISEMNEGREKYPDLIFIQVNSLKIQDSSRHFS